MSIDFVGNCFLFHSVYLLQIVSVRGHYDLPPADCSRLLKRSVACFLEQKNALNRILVSVKDELLSTKKYIKIRGATLIHGMTRALSEIPTYPRQLTYAHTLQNTL